MPLLACIFLRYLKLNRLVRVLERAKQRRNRLSDLEIDGSIFDLDQNVIVELSVELRKIVVSGFRAVVLQIAPIHFVVVHEAAIDQNAAMRFQCSRDHIGSVRMSTSVRRWPHSALGIGL